MHAIEVQGVSKTYRIPHERHTTLAERVLSLFRPVPVEILLALDDVTLDIPAGSFVGVIGANGSGKSTLLKILAGLLVPDRGQVHVHGTLSPLLELGLGFHNELTVRENVAIYGTVLGFPRRDLERRIEEVIQFAGLERFRDAKLKSLSSGMLIRLAFATALRADADILLLDEVLAVGDAQFQRKCFDVFAELRRQRKTIVLVSHDLYAVQRFCEHVFWLDHGRLISEGDATRVVDQYLSLSQSLGLATTPPKEQGEAPDRRWGDGRIRYVSGGLESEDGRPLTNIRAGSRVVLRLAATIREPCDGPVFGFVVRCGSQIVYSTNNALLGVATPAFAAGDHVAIRIPFTAALPNGHYGVHVAIADHRQGTVHDWINQFLDFTVEGSACGEGVADLCAGFSCDTAAARPLPGPAAGAGSAT